MCSIRFMSYVQKITSIFYLSLFLRNLTKTNLIILAVIAVIKYKIIKMDK